MGCFLGAYLYIKSDRHAHAIPATILISIILLIGSQIILERILGLTTPLAMISRLLPMSSGQIMVRHLDVSKDDSSILARHLAILRQENQIQLRLSVKDVVGSGRYPHSRGRLNIEDKEHIDLALKYLNKI